MTKCHILVKVIYPGYYSRYYTPLIDTGASINICKDNCLPKEAWKELENKILVKGFNNKESVIKFIAKDIDIQIWDKIVKIRK